MKKLIHLKGVQELDVTQQKEINGGIKKCQSSCAGRPEGARCYYQGHCSCPGECSNNQGCIPY